MSDDWSESFRYLTCGLASSTLVFNMTVKIKLPLLIMAPT